MNDMAQIITALGTAVAAVIAALFAGLAVLISARNSRISARNSTKIDEVHVLANSLSDRANAAERAAGRLEGELVGRDHITAQVGATVVAAAASAAATAASVPPVIPVAPATPAPTEEKKS